MNAVSITKYRVINVANENRAVVAGWMNHHDPHHQSKMFVAQIKLLIGKGKRS